MSGHYYSPWWSPQSRKVKAVLRLHAISVFDSLASKEWKTGCPKHFAINIYNSARRVFPWVVPAGDREDECYCKRHWPLPVGTFTLYGYADVKLFRYDMPKEKFHTILAIHYPSAIGDGERGLCPHSASQLIFSQNAHGMCHLLKFASGRQRLLPLQRALYDIWP